MKDLISKLSEEITYYSGEISKRRLAIERLQDLCAHDKLEDYGHDSHHNYTKCTTCGKTFRD